MSYKVWRWKDTQEIVGYCRAGNTAFEPGGNQDDYTIILENVEPRMPPDPPSALSIKRAAVLADPIVPATVKAFIAVLTPP